MAVRVRQPLPVYRAVDLSHEEYKSKDNGEVECVKVDDCRFLCDPEDFDLEVQQRAGVNLKEVDTHLFQHSLAYPKVSDEVETQKTDEKEGK